MSQKRDDRLQELNYIEPMFDNEKIIKITGEVIRKTIDIQVLVSEIVSRHYLGNQPNENHVGFIHDIMTNKYAPLALAIDALERVLKTRNVEPKRVEELGSEMRKLGNIRNAFAHEITVINPVLSPGKIFHPDRKSIPWPKNMAGVDTDEEYSSFIKLYENIKTKIAKLQQELGLEKIDIRST